MRNFLKQRLHTLIIDDARFSDSIGFYFYIRENCISVMSHIILGYTFNLNLFNGFYKIILYIYIYGKKHT